jgi:hypothetical protein
MNTIATFPYLPEKELKNSSRFIAFFFDEIKNEKGFVNIWWIQVINATFPFLSCSNKKLVCNSKATSLKCGRNLQLL